MCVLGSAANVEGLESPCFWMRFLLAARLHRHAQQFPPLWEGTGIRPGGDNTASPGSSAGARGLGKGVSYPISHGSGGHALCQTPALLRKPGALRTHGGLREVSMLVSRRAGVQNRHSATEDPSQGETQPHPPGVRWTMTPTTGA